MDGDYRTIDRELFKVRATMTVELRVKVREDPALEERIITEINTTDKMGGLELIAASEKDQTTDFFKRLP